MPYTRYFCDEKEGVGRFVPVPVVPNVAHWVSGTVFVLLYSITYTVAHYRPSEAGMPRAWRLRVGHHMHLTHDPP